MVIFKAWSSNGSSFWLTLWPMCLQKSGRMSQDVTRSVSNSDLDMNFGARSRHPCHVSRSCGASGHRDQETSEREMIHELNLLSTISHPRILGMIGAGFERTWGWGRWVPLRLEVVWICMSLHFVSFIFPGNNMVEARHGRWMIL